MKRKVLEKIKKQIHAFDLCSLVRLLEQLGYSRKDIYFESNANLVSPRSLCESIIFTEEAPHVRVTLNMGLLGTNSPLPSFFRKYSDMDEINGDQFNRFLSFFNHHLIQEFLKMTLPEKNEGLFANWIETHYHYLTLLGFESISTLWLLFKSCFPELVIDIAKNARMMRLHSSTLVLGRDGLGPASYIGERLEQILSSFKVTFYTDEEMSEQRTPWPMEINQRLNEWIFPILKKTEIHLSIILVVKNKYNHMHLSPNHYLGFDRIGKSTHPFQMMLFHGFIKDLKRNAYLA